MPLTGYAALLGAWVGIFGAAAGATSPQQVARLSVDL